MATPERQTTLLIAAGTALLPLQIWPPMPLPGMQLSDLFFALAFAHFLVTRRALPPAGIAVPIVAFAAGVAASTLFGGSPVKLLGHLMLAALGWMAVCAPPEGSRMLRRALVAAAALAALTAMATVAGFFAGVIGYDAAGNPDSPLLYIHGALVSDHYPRPRGTMVTGALLTSLVATGFALLWFERELVPDRWVRGLIFALCALTLFFAFSRTMATFALVLACAELWRRDSPPWARGALASVAVVYVAALWISLRYHVVLNPTEPWAVDVLASDGDRFGRWRIAVATIAENPVLGVGPGIRVADGWSAHNTWLNLWAGIGIVPLVAFAFLMLASLRAAIRAQWLGVACALTVALIESSYNDIEDLRHVWLLIGIALGAAPGAGRVRRSRA
ncbi:MAG TPA: O-antigen ligase family protein [Thermohalobaculum sp.]|nr:O-antigen ligase family protein [Thermohalobaculum sp.]